MELTQERLKELLDYDPLTGCLTWISRPSNRVKVGDFAGHLRKDGYLDTKIDGRLYLNHRLAFLYMLGTFPKDQVDHIDRNKTNNKWANLRDVTNKENCMNKSIQKRNSSGFGGVHWNKTNKKWEAKISVDGNDIFLGLFDDINDAANARRQANIQHGFNENHGFDLHQRYLEEVSR